MRTRIKIIVFVGLTFFWSCVNNAASQTYGPATSVSFQVFYDQLSPYGMWVNYPPYGYVWVPEVGWGYAPYVTSGNWVYTSYGWTWYSYYPWGWATFHYGRWFYDNWLGWVWVPDNVWAPAWVVWSIGGGYCGWSPLGPNMTVNVVLRGKQTIPREHWVFVRDRDLSNRRIDRYRIDRSKNGVILEKATLIRETREHQNENYIPGPNKNEIQRAIGKPVNPIAIRERNKPGGDRLTGNQFELFKPQVQRENTSIKRTVPDKVFELNDLEKHNDRNQPINPSRKNYGEYRERPELRHVNPGNEINQQWNMERGRPGKKGRG